MLFGKLNKLVDIRFNYVNATMHGWYAITLSLQSHTLSPVGINESQKLLRVIGIQKVIISLYLYIRDLQRQSIRKHSLLHQTGRYLRYR